MVTLSLKKLDPQGSDLNCQFWQSDFKIFLVDPELIFFLIPGTASASFHLENCTFICNLSVSINKMMIVKLLLISVMDPLYHFTGYHLLELNW